VRSFGSALPASATAMDLKSWKDWNVENVAWFQRITGKCLVCVCVCVFVCECVCAFLYVCLTERLIEGETGSGTSDMAE
jgi:hypothetical protein